MTPCTRRKFVGRAALVIAGTACAVRAAAPTPSTSPRKLFAGIGITAPIRRASELKAAGADYIVPTVADFLMPDRPESEFDEQRTIAARGVLPVLGCNSFLRHPRLRCTGPDADHTTVLEFSETAFRRLAKAGGKFIGFGSNTSRQIPDDWSKARADEQFVALLRAMGPLAAKHGITVSVEQQRRIECNYLNRIDEVVAVVAAANHPNIRALADLYHMAVMGDTPDDLDRAMPWVGLVELAEKEKRTLPGITGDDFRPWFAALARGGYKGYISIEGDGSPEQLTTAFATIARQSAEAIQGVRKGSGLNG
ncbi:MAG: TIM barrel protein [Opitutus sp.]